MGTPRWLIHPRFHGSSTEQMVVFNVQKESERRAILKEGWLRRKDDKGYLVCKKVERKTEAAEWIAKIHFAKGTLIRGKPLRPMENRKESTKQFNVQFKAAEYIPRTPNERNVTCSTCLGKGHQ
jgi:hypothetical protein